MKKLLIVVFVLFSVLLSADRIEEFKEFQRDISRQAGQFQGSALHEQIKANRESREYVVGDTEIYWAWDLSVMPPLWIQTPAT